MKAFTEAYRSTFQTFPDYLKEELLTNIEQIPVAHEENELSDKIFQSLEGTPLVDPYEAYQLLDNDWNQIAGDLEMIQTEGFQATKRVDPRMIIKKKDNKEQEVQDGWTGHILPFSLVQETYFSKELAAIKETEDRLSEITAGYEEALDSLPEEEKEND